MLSPYSPLTFLLHSSSSSLSLLFLSSSYLPLSSYSPLTLSPIFFLFQFYDKFVNLHGKTHDHKIVYDNIERIFCLLRPDDFYYIVLGVEPPLRQETKRYKYVVLQFVSGEQIEGLSVQLGAAEESRDRLDYLKGKQTWGRMREGRERER